MMLTAGIDAAEGKSQCSPGFTAGVGVWPEAVTLASDVGDGSAETAGGFSAGAGAFQLAT